MRPQKSFEINGPRPSPLLIHNHSRLIRKAPPSQQPQLRQPIIIYTHSPKIIHTQPKDFMALVQRLTGYTPADATQHNTLKKQPLSLDSDINLNDNDCSSVLTTDDDDHINHCGDRGQSNSSLYLSEGPLFTPRSNSSSVLRHSSFDTTPFSSSPGLVNSLSPSFMEFLKGLPDF